MTKIELEAPLRVSPFIKFCRWSALVVGIYYGASRFRSLKKKEDAEREYIAKMKPIWMEEKAKKLKAMEREQLLYMAKETGVKIPSDFDQKFPPSN